MCYGDCGCFLRAMRKEGLTPNEAEALLHELQDRVETGELEPEEALASVGLDSRYLLALQDWP